MSANPIQPSDLVRPIIDQAKRIHEDALFCYAGHSEEARRWGAVTIQLGVPATIIAAAAGITSLSGQNSSVHISVAVGVLAFLVAAMSGLSTFLDPKGQASKHYQASIGYLKLCNETRIFYEIECARSANIEELENNLKKLGTRLNDLHDATPMISERARVIADRNVKSGRYMHEIDKPPEKLTQPSEGRPRSA